MMSCSEIICSLIVGLVSGIVSSFLFSFFWKSYWDRVELKKAFENDKQAYHRYLLKLRNTIKSETNSRHSAVLAVFEEEPIRESFTNISATGDALMQEIQEYLRTTRTQFERQDELADDEYIRIESKLLNYSIDVLKTVKMEDNYNGPTDFR